MGRTAAMWTVVVALVLAVEGCAATDGLVVNGLVDFIFREVLARVPDNVTLPGIELIVKRWRIATGEGRLDGLSSVRRRGDATFWTDDNSTKISLDVSVRRLVVAFDRYELGAGKLGKLSGSLWASVATNRASVEITLVHEPCSLRLTTARIIELSDFSVSVTGLKMLNKLLSGIISWIGNRYAEKVRSLLNSNIDSVANRILSQIKLCTVIKK